MWYPQTSHSSELIRHFVGGQWHDGANDEPKSRFSPYTGEKICELNAAPQSLINQAIDTASVAQKE